MLNLRNRRGSGLSEAMQQQDRPGRRRGALGSAFGLLLAVVVVVGLSACGSEGGMTGESPANESPQVSSTPTASLPPVAPEPDNDAVSQALVGLPEAAAQAKAEAAGYTVRVAVVDGEPRALTMDYRPDRINVELENGVVVGAYVS